MRETVDPNMDLRSFIRQIKPVGKSVKSRWREYEAWKKMICQRYELDYLEHEEAMKLLFEQLNL